MPKFPQPLIRVALIAATGLVLLLLAAFRFQNGGDSQVLEPNSTASNRLASLPSTIIWAWERPEKLDYLDRQKLAVAFLAKTIYLRGDEAINRPRLQPLEVSPGVPLIAVARIESERAKPATLSPLQLKDTVQEISALGSNPDVVMVQVDFDATVSERDFYRSLLTELRAKLPTTTLLSITALASWCQGDNWLDELPIDEAVPMLFRMGVERNQFLSQLAAGEKFKARRCQESVGISTDEPINGLPMIQRTYVFNPASWSPSQVQKVMEANAK